jgi:hypothetical protein
MRLARELSTNLSGPAASANGWRIRGGSFQVLALAWAELVTRGMNGDGSRYFLIGEIREYV